ncbi:MAG: quinolinate synthase NadA [Clostridiales bacterium]|nr:quinolinate synthase NadA [Clostridiales bacterium]
MSHDELITRIEELKKEKDAVICAHYYVDEEVQKISDYVGDSFYLAKVAANLKEQTIVFCGVSFMGESAKVLSPEKTILMPDPTADCPMAHMAMVSAIEKYRKHYDDLAVVCYVNSTAELKMHSDVCVTSSNALKIVRKLPNKNIFFIPDINLGSYVKKMVPEKNIILNEGFCPVHKEIEATDVETARVAHPNAKLLVHPECSPDVIELADYAGSTSEIIEYANQSECDEFIIGTEIGVFYELKKRCPNKEFFPIKNNQICKDMKKISLEKVYNALNTMSPTVELSDEEISRAKSPLMKMLELA